MSVETFAEYQALAQRTARTKLSPRERLSVAGLGLAGESGEVAEIVKKHIGHDHPLDRDEVRKEVGDVLWYVAEMCAVTGLTMEECAAANIEKLRTRYPEGFAVQDSIDRVDVTDP